MKDVIQSASAMMAMAQPYPYSYSYSYSLWSGSYTEEFQLQLLPIAWPEIAVEME